MIIAISVDAIRENRVNIEKKSYLFFFFNASDLGEILAISQGHLYGEDLCFSGHMNLGKCGHLLY